MVAAPAPAAAQEPNRRDPFQRQVRPLLERYCADCHMNGEAEAGIALDRFENQAAAIQDGRTWLRVRDALQGRIMPPADESQPFAALAFKIMADPFVGKLTYFRVYSGKLEAGARVLNVSTAMDEEKIGLVVESFERAAQRVEQDIALAV